MPWASLKGSHEGSGSLRPRIIHNTRRQRVGGSGSDEFDAKDQRNGYAGASSVGSKSDPNASPRMQYVTEKGVVRTAEDNEAIQIMKVEELTSLRGQEDMNTEIYLYRRGLRLEDVFDKPVGAIHGIMQASLFPAGYAGAWCCKTIDFPEEAVKGRKVFNEKPYNFTIFGTPSDEPWS
ncbi:hypothetical protein FE257_001841 [Aspergillus nanangensis]|uniref:Uncharacterized protein n=1 Tax=Aspergillus nanangensis TaxID=2582783 RepID=A0AAD4CDB4_ASPNN|nr:hypothetical protein FE257_001841 [Aspergillus nanangensis]